MALLFGTFGGDRAPTSWGGRTAVDAMRRETPEAFSPGQRLLHADESVRVAIDAWEPLAARHLDYPPTPL